MECSQDNLCGFEEELFETCRYILRYDGVDMGKVRRGLAEMSDIVQQILYLRGSDEDRITDKDRLDFLDMNLKLNMPWKVRIADAGNIVVTSITGSSGMAIREAIDLAIIGKKEG